MKRLIGFVFFTFGISSLVAAPGAHGPDGQHLTETRQVGASGIGRQADGTVLMPFKHQAMLGITTVFATTSEVKRHVRLDGIIQPHADGHAVIQSSSDGRLQASQDGLPISGDRVKAGDIIGHVHYQDSAYEYATQTSELLTVRNEIQQTRRDVQRLEELGKLSSKQSLEQLQTRLKSLIQKEQVLQNSLEKPEPLVAPISGVLINHNVSVGQWVTSGTTLFEIISPEKRLINALSTDPSIISQLSTAYIPGKRMMEVNYKGYSPRLSSGMITLHFALVQESVEHIPLLIGQPVELLATIDKPLSGLVLPASSIVFDGSNLPVVWIKLSAEKFMSQHVQYEQLDGDRVVITSGLGADNRVVVNGTSLLNQIR